MEHRRVRAAVKDAGVSIPEGRDLGDAVLELADRSATGTDASLMSSFSVGEGSAGAAAAAAVEERHQAELEEIGAALRKGEAERSALKEQMIA
ncbi:unnamed protein product, partial [Laminaria digitata]